MPAVVPSKARIAERLKGTIPAPDPDRAARERLPAPVAEEWFRGPLIPAAVLVPLVERRSGFTVLLTRRTEHLRDHPGQISLPGGRVEAGDSDVRATALREACEELGIEPGLVTVLGYLPVHPVITGFAITPVVGFLPDGITLQLDPAEVAETFEVPLEFLLMPGSARQISRQVRGIEVPLFEYQYARYRIWGATANILRTLTNTIS